MSYKYETSVVSRDRSNRYRNCRVITDSESKTKFLESLDIKEIPVSTSDQYHTVSANEEHRLDLIAYNYYDNAELWWVIAIANHIYNTLLEPVPGEILRVPSVTTLYGTGGILL